MRTSSKSQLLRVLPGALCVLAAAAALALAIAAAVPRDEGAAHRQRADEMQALRAETRELVRAMALARAECKAAGYDSVGGCAQSEEDYAEDQKAIKLARAAVHKRDELHAACRRLQSKAECFRQLHAALQIDKSAERGAAAVDLDRVGSRE